VRTLGKRV